MTILEALKQLRDDLKLWVTNNIRALNEAKADADHTHKSSEIASLATVALSNRYDDLYDKPVFRVASGTAIIDDTYVLNSNYSGGGMGVTILSDSANKNNFKVGQEYTITIGDYTTTSVAYEDLSLISNKEYYLCYLDFTMTDDSGVSVFSGKLRVHERGVHKEDSGNSYQPRIDVITYDSPYAYLSEINIKIINNNDIITTFDAELLPEHTHELPEHTHDNLQGQIDDINTQLGDVSSILESILGV